MPSLRKLAIGLFLGVVLCAVPATIRADHYDNGWYGPGYMYDRPYVRRTYHPYGGPYYYRPYYRPYYRRYYGPDAYIRPYYYRPYYNYRRYYYNRPYYYGPYYGGRSFQFRGPGFGFYFY